MITLATEVEISNAISVSISEDSLSVELDDGRTVTIPISWYPRLFHASEKERLNFRLIGNGAGIHWEDLDEDISTAGIIAGHRSQESQSSFKKWLEQRSKAK